MSASALLCKAVAPARVLDESDRMKSFTLKEPFQPDQQAEEFHVLTRSNTLQNRRQAKLAGKAPSALSKLELSELGSTKRRQLLGQGTFDQS